MTTWFSEDVQHAVEDLLEEDAGVYGEMSLTRCEPTDSRPVDVLYREASAAVAHAIQMRSMPLAGEETVTAVRDLQVLLRKVIAAAVAWEASADRQVEAITGGQA